MSDDSQINSGVINNRLEHERMVFALAMQSSHMGVWERNLETGHIWWSEELEDIFGLPKGGFTGTHDEYRDLIYEPDRDLAAAAVAEALEKRQSYCFEFRFHHGDGSLRWMEGRGQAVYDSDGKPLRLYGVGIDITERKAAEEKARVLSEINSLVQEMTDPAEIMAATARILGDHLGVDRCAYAEVENEDVFNITGDYTRDVPSIVGRWPVAAFGSECVRQMLENEPYVVFDSEGDARIGPDDLPAYRATNIRAVICLPLHKHGKFTAAMAVHQQVPRRWTAEEIELVKLVVARCWESLERTRAARRALESDERFRLALSSGAVTVYEQDAELRYRWLYPETPYGQVIGLTDEDLSPGSGLNVVKNGVIASGQPLRTEISAVVAGQERWYDLFIEPRFSPTGAVTGIGGTALDITERKEAEQKLKAAAERLSLAFTAGDLGEWSWEISSDLLDLSPKAAEIFGLRPGKRETWARLQQTLVPEDRDRTIAEVERAVENRSRYDIEYRVNHPDGRQLWVAAVGRAFYNESGTPMGMYGILQDITPRKQLQEELFESEARFRGLMEQAPLSIQLFAPDGQHIQVNRAWEKLWGLNMEVLPDYNILRDQQLEEKGIAENIRRAFAGEEAVELPVIEYDPEATIPGKSKHAESKRWVSAIIYPLKDPSGNVREVALVHQDITEQKRAEQQVNFQKTLLESLTEAVLDGILIVSPEGKMLHFNQRFLEIWNFPQYVLDARSDEAALTWAAEQTDDAQAFLRRVINVYAAPDEQAREEVRMRDGRVFERFGAPVFHGDTRLGWVWTFRDITDRKEFEAGLERARAELETRVVERTRELADTNELLLVQMREREAAEAQRLDLLKRLFSIQEDERGRIARDIHDQLGQRVTALRLNTEVIKSLSIGNEGLSERAAELQNIARQLDHEVSFVAWELRPSILDDLLFADALENYVREWSRHSQIHAEFHTNGSTAITLSRDVETNLYRIAQEALNNAAKHSKASTINVLLEGRKDEVTLIIEDDGVGLDPSSMDQSADLMKGFGLMGMRERASLIGGTLEIESSANGTSLYIRVPVIPSDDHRTPALM